MITVTELKTYLQLDGTGSDGFLQVCIDQAVSQIETYCKRSFENASYTQYATGNNRNKMIMKNYPLVSVDSIEVLDSSGDWNNLFTGSDSTANSLFIVEDTNSFELTKGYVFPKSCRSNNVKVTYTAGWGTGEAEEDIQGVTYEMASVFYFNSPKSGNARLGKSGENLNSTASEGASFKDLRPEWKDRLNKYRIKRIG